MFTPDISSGFKTFNIVPNNVSEELSAAITLKNGNLLLISEPFSNTGELFMHQFAPDGRSLTGVQQVNTTTFGAQKGVEVTQLQNGNFVVGWTDASATSPDFNGTTVRFQIFNAAGQKVGSEVTTPTDTTGDQTLTSMVALEDGRFAVLWTHRSETGSRIRVYNADGTPAGADQTLPVATDSRGLGAIASYGAHGFAEVLVTGSFPNSSVSVQRYSDAGSPVGGLIAVATGSGFGSVRIAHLDNGNLAVTWTDRSETPPYNHGSVVRGQVLDISGNKVGAVFTVSDDIFSEHRNSTVTALSDGRFAVTWNTGPADEVYQHKDVMRVYNADGTAASEILTVYDQQADYAGIRGLLSHLNSVSELPDGRLLYSYSALTPSASEFLTATRIVDPRAALDVTLGDGADSFTGTRFNDKINGGGGHDSLTGGAGNDTLDGGSGNDSLAGGLGHDSLLGGLGNDRLLNEAGNDTLDGGAGIDTAVFTGSIAVSVNLGVTTAQNTGYGTDVLVRIENLLSGSGNDALAGNSAANILQSGAGDDTLRGGAGNDLLYGGTGADRLTGGAGRDVLYGGAGDGMADVFVFSAITESVKGAARDVIFDFVSGKDDINLAGIDANTALANNQAFVWAGTTATAHAVWYTVSAGNLLLRGDVNGDSVFDFEIQLSGMTSLVRGDVIL